MGGCDYSVNGLCSIHHSAPLMCTHNSERCPIASYIKIQQSRATQLARLQYEVDLLAFDFTKALIVIRHAPEDRARLKELGDRISAFERTHSSADTVYVA